MHGCYCIDTGLDLNGFTSAMRSHSAQCGNGRPQGLNEWKYGILRAAEEVVRAGVLSYVSGSESELVSPVSQSIDWSLGLGVGVVVWVLFVCFGAVVSFFLDQSVCSSYQPMTYLAYLHDCHCCHNERSLDQKKKRLQSLSRTSH